MRPLTKLRHFSALNENLMSMGTFDSNDCEYSATSIVFKVEWVGFVIRQKAKSSKTNTS